MKTLQLIWFHLKRILFNNWGYIAVTFGFPLFIISGFLFIMQDDDSMMAEQDVAVLNHSEFVEENIVPHLSETYQDYVVEDREEAFNRLDQIEVSIVYEIPEDFPQTDERIQVYSLGGENRDGLFEAQFMTTFLEQQLDAAYAKADITFESVEVAAPHVIVPDMDLEDNMAFIVFMVLFFMGYSAGLVGGDLADLRKQGLLTRSIVSNSYSWQILGSILMAYIIYSVLASLVIIFLMSAIFNVGINDFGLILSLLVSMSIFIAGLTMVLFRIFKNEAVIQIIGIILVIALVFLGMASNFVSDAYFLQYISPYYWVFEAIDTGQIFPHTLIIILFGLVLFTAGSFKIERLVKA